MDAGHRVVVIVQEAKARSRTDLYHSMGAVELAYFPTGTIAFGHALGWANDTRARRQSSLHSWHCNEYDCLRVPAEAQH
eukprot:3659392-Prymnesium_polylepis.1